MSLTEKKSNAPNFGGFFNDSSINIDAKALMNRRYPIANSDRYAVIAHLPDPDEKSNKFFIRIFSMHPTVKAAEAEIRAAYESSYTYFDLLVVDTRCWLPFPPEKFENERQGSELLAKIMDKQIQQSRKEVTDLKKRVRESKPTTPFEEYKKMVINQAKKMIEAVEGKNGKEYVEKMKRDFEEYQNAMQNKMDKEVREEAKNFDMDAMCKKATA